MIYLYELTPTFIFTFNLIHSRFKKYILLFCTDELIFHKFENAFPLDKNSWGYIKNMDVMSFKELLETVVITVSCGGKLKLKMFDQKSHSIYLCLYFDNNTR